MADNFNEVDGSAVAGADLEIECPISKEILKLPASNIGSMTEGEVWDYVEREAKGRGWSVRRDGRGNRYAVAPSVLIREDEIRNLELYDEQAKCPKCRYGDVKTKYHTGLPEGGIYAEPDIEYMERECQRCEYRWFQKPLDSESNDGKESDQSDDAAGQHDGGGKSDSFPEERSGEPVEPERYNGRCHHCGSHTERRDAPEDHLIRSICPRCGQRYG